MKTRIFLAISAAFLFAGCGSQLAHLYPVQGPLSAQTPLPVYAAKVTGLNRTGKFYIVLAGGEVCTGQWTRILTSPRSLATTSAPTDAMASIWDSIYGQGFYVAHVLGANFYGQGTATGTNGTVLNVEMYAPPAGSDGISAREKGVAKDNHGNIFKLAF